MATEPQRPQTVEPPIHRDEVLPAIRTILRMCQTHERPLILQVAGINGDEDASSVAEALARIAQEEMHVGVLLVGFDEDSSEDSVNLTHGLSQVRTRRRAGSDSDVGLIKARMHSSLLRSAIAARVDIGLSDLPPEIVLVVLDTEPLLKSVEAAVIGQQMDGVILVASARNTLAGDAHRALADITQAGGNPIGLIVNHRRFRTPAWLARLFGSAVAPRRIWPRKSAEIAVLDPRGDDSLPGIAPKVARKGR